MTDGATKALELTSVRAIILDVVSTNITDPLTGQEARASTDHWIFDGFPNRADIGKPAPTGWKFPIVVIRYPDSELEDASLDSTKHHITHTVLIETFSRSRSQAMTLAQSIMNILQTTAADDLRTGSLHGPTNVTINTEIVDFIGGNKHYNKPIDYTFKRFD